MKIACIGGGPASLFFSILMAKQDADHDITVYERNRRGDTFGFGVVFSDETLANIAETDPDSIAAIESEFRHWGAMDVRYRGRTITSDGHGFAALSRLRLLEILTIRAIELGVRVEFETEIDVDSVACDADLVVAGDGVNSGTRTRYADDLRPVIRNGAAKYIWTATDTPFDRFTFIFEDLFLEDITHSEDLFLEDITHSRICFDDTAQRTVQAHIYPYDETRSTFIVEMAESTWQSLQLGGHDAASAQANPTSTRWTGAAGSSPSPRGPAPHRQQLEMDQLPPHLVQLMGHQQHRPAGRRRPHRSLLGGQRHQDGAGGCHRARRCHGRDK